MVRFYNFVKSGAGRIQAIGHQDQTHFIPQMKDLEKFAPEETKQLYYQNQDLINWLIEHHMDFTSGQGFSKKFIAQNFDGAKVKPTQQMKLLLILMWADKMGRLPEDTIKQAIQKNSQNLLKSSEKGQKRANNIANQSSSFQGGPIEFATMLKNRKIPFQARVQAMKGKFPKMSDDQIVQLVESNNQPTILNENIPVPKECFVVAQALKDGNPQAEVYAVGGCVRDYLFGKTPKDFDLTCNLSEQEILDQLRNAGLKVAEKESDTFGVVFVHVGGEPIEVAPFRSDIGIADGRRPDEVKFGVSIAEDALRRDFTMNNLYYDFGFGRFGKNSIIDLNPGGQGLQDVKNKVVRPVGNPFDRFKEDRFRILRLLRFFSRYNSGDISQFLDDQTQQAIQKYGDLRQPIEGLQPISGERIQGEFLAGLIQSQNTVAFLKNYVKLNLINSVFPGMKFDIQGIDRVGNSKNVKVVLAWLLRENSNVAKKLNQLKFPSELYESVQFLIDCLKFGVENVFSMAKRRDKNAEISLALKKDLKEFSQLVHDPSIAQRLTHFSQYDMPTASGNDLMAQGFQGPEIGREQQRLAQSDYEKSFKQFLQQ